MLAAVLGSPVSHSLSPLLHNAAYRALGLPHEYSAIEMSAAELPDFIRGRNSLWLGVSLTMPLKEVASVLAQRLVPQSWLLGNLEYRTSPQSHEITAHWPSVLLLPHKWESPLQMCRFPRRDSTPRLSRSTPRRLEWRMPLCHTSTVSPALCWT